MLEMPSGTGKTVSLLSLIVAYIRVSRLSRSCNVDMQHIQGIFFTWRFFHHLFKGRDAISADKVLLP